MDVFCHEERNSLSRENGYPIVQQNHIFLTYTSHAPIKKMIFKLSQSTIRKLLDLLIVK